MQTTEIGTRFAENSIPHQPPRFLIITPVRDEAAHIESTIKSMLDQTIKPVEWIIVNDGSTDATGNIIDRYASEISWIKTVHRADRGFRKSGAGVVEAFYEGLNIAGTTDWNFLVKLDGDLTFTKDYFEQIYDRFCKEPRLGVGGGTIYSADKGTIKREKGPQFHVRGATKVYRRACWEAIQGLHVVPGWDALDEIKANQLGWKTQTFLDLQIIQQRPTGTAESWWKDRVKNGRAYYVAGYHPIFFIAKFFFRATKRPYVLGAVAMTYGFLSGYLNGVERVKDPSLIRYIRREQIRRLLGRETIWR